MSPHPFREHSLGGWPLRGGGCSREPCQLRVGLVPSEHSRRAPCCALPGTLSPREQTLGRESWMGSGGLKWTGSLDHGGLGSLSSKQACGSCPRPRHPGTLRKGLCPGPAQVTTASLSEQDGGVP